MKTVPPGIEPQPLARGSVREVFRQGGEHIDLSGNAPRLLEDPGSAWLVTRGRVNVFAVDLVDGVPGGPRHYLFSAAAGELLVGVEPAWAGDVGLLAVGTVDAQALRLSIGELTSVPGLGEELRGLLAGYVHAFTTMVAAREVPRADVLLTEGDERHCADTLHLTGRKGVTWIQVPAGELRFTGRDRLAVRREDGAFPLSCAAWMTSTPGTTVRALHERDLSEIDLWNGLRAFQRIALEWSAHVIDEDRAADESRLQMRLQADAALGDAALRSLRGVIADGSRERADPGEGALLGACRIVGSALGIDVRAAPVWERGRGNIADEIRALARSSGVACRRVALASAWWTKDNGPLLGFVHVTSEIMQEGKPTSRPVGLIPAPGAGYRAHEPTSGRAFDVDDAFASTLEPFAYQFYRTLPPRRLGTRDLWRFVAFGVRADVRMLVILGMASAMLGLLLPLLTGVVFDHVIPTADRAQLGYVFAALLATAIAVTAFQLTRSFAVIRFHTQVESGLQLAVLDRLLRLPLPFFRAYAVGDLARRAQGVSAIGQTLGAATITAILSALVSAGAFVLLFVYSTPLALLATAILALNLAFTSAAAYYSLRYARELQDVQGRLAGVVLELLTGVAKLRVAGAEVRTFARWSRDFAKQRELGYRFGQFGNDVHAFNSVLSIASSLALYGFYVLLAREPGGGLTTGAFLGFNAAFGLFMASALALSGIGIQLVALIPTWERAKPILDAVPEVDMQKPDPGELMGRIEVSRLTFRYGPAGPLVLDDVSLEAGPGEFVAIVGPSGAGKSTLLRILLGFDRSDGSSVYYDGHDLTRIDVTAVRRQIGVVLQSSRLTAGTILSNVVGSGSYTQDDAWEALRQAGMEDEVRAMPMTLHTFVSEGGESLSGGQRQRLLIARALVHRPRVIFFDEATSALDNRAQQLVADSVAALHATRIVIAHRLTTIRNANRIYVLDRGRIVQSGTFEELIAAPSLFADMAARQET